MKGREVREAELYSPESELQVLGCILLDAKASFEALKDAGVNSRYFYDLRNRELFQLLERMVSNGDEVASYTVYHRAKEAQLKWAEDGPQVLASLSDTVPTATAIRMFIEDLEDKYQRRFALDAARRLEKVAADKSAPAARLLEDSEEAIRALRRLSSPAPFTVRSAAELITEPMAESDNLLGDRLLARGQSLTLLGAGGIGKSRLLLQLAACCITGRPFVSLPVHQPNLKWLIFQAENSKRRLQDDLRRLRDWLGEEDWQRVAERLFIHTVEGEQDCFVQLDQHGVRQRLGDVIERFDPDVVCFDPLNCFGIGDLNRDSDMRATCLAITQLAATGRDGKDGRPPRATIVLHHALTGKAGAARATGIERSSFGRNSKLLQAWTRGQINLAPANANDNMRLVLSCGKCSNGEEFAPFAIRLKADSMIYEAEPEFDHAAWQRSLAEGPQRVPEDDLLEICAHPAMRAEAARKLLAKGYSQAYAYRIIQRAITDGLVRLEGNILHRVE
ncbi:MAG TPA: AAA family ATPase [Verrucomicrobiae bacterium]